MKVHKALSIDDLRKLAKARLPKVIFDYLEGGAEDEACLDSNAAAFARHKFIPRYLVDISRRDQSVNLFGQTYASPFGIAPTGMIAMVRPDADLMLAQAAAQADVPFVISGASTASIEEIARVAPKSWYQHYPCRDEAMASDLFRRVADAGLMTLVVTVDVPLHSKRERNIRSGWVRPYKPTLPVMLEAARHPAWVIEYLTSGLPYMENYRRYAPPGTNARALTSFYAEQVPTAQSWQTIERIRSEWSGTLVLKGIMHPDDALKAVAAGVDGIIVSNHGGRQLDRSIAPVDVLPEVVAAVGDRVTVMLDSGIRRGADIATALCLGAQFTLVGRAPAYGVSAGGTEGALRALSILRQELDLVCGQLGCPRVSELNEAWLESARGNTPTAKPVEAASTAPAPAPQTNRTEARAVVTS
ncbi:alpha-hydroxy acid oxidase [Paraburkholderia lycopersici]|uniref:L-lactate dehydrogenase (Cytochrome)/(S)-mandelate dehydrogenase n=1 Tax=Paraburkholderia lycopersici TaxID=416944 RepID=A0A1G6X7N3_9BURK|nr:alpha-hydroxy acid oxidase [Paraburkholderia lycopersici]SDD74149.1 L-lactate dehydrogenase (cytochrome)/(S)-mandelate dehydrogenase [Paraburkholderia lycopersici]